MFFQRYESINLQPINEMLLHEGKKEAIAYLTSNINSVEAGNVIRNLQKIDYSNGKWILLLAQIFVKLVNEHKYVNAKFKDLYEVIKDEYIPLLDKIDRKNLKVDVYKEFKKFNYLEDFLKWLKNPVGIPSKNEIKKIIHSGLSSLKNNKDYYEISDYPPMYIPLNIEASRTIACKQFGGVEGHWCTAYPNTVSHWNNYIYSQKGILVYIINLESEDENYKKIAIYFYPNGQSEIFNAKDSKMSEQELKLAININSGAIKKMFNWGHIRDIIEERRRASKLEVESSWEAVADEFGYSLSDIEDYIEAMEEMLEDNNFSLDEIENISDDSHGFLDVTVGGEEWIFCTESDAISVVKDTVSDNIDIYDTYINENNINFYIDEEKLARELLWIERDYARGRGRDNPEDYLNESPEGTEECDTCDGTGKIEVDGEMEDCPDCEGLGYILTDEWTDEQIEKAEDIAEEQIKEEIESDPVQYAKDMGDDTEFLKQYVDEYKLAREIAEEPAERAFIIGGYDDNEYEVGNILYYRRN